MEVVIPTRTIFALQTKSAVYPGMGKKQKQIEMRIVNVNFPRFIIVHPNGRYWTGKAWNEKRVDALVFAHADELRNTINRLNAEFHKDLS